MFTSHSRKVASSTRVHHWKARKSNGRSSVNSLTVLAGMKAIWQRVKVPTL